MNEPIQLNSYLKVMTALANAPSIVIQKLISESDSEKEANDIKAIAKLLKINIE